MAFVRFPADRVLWSAPPAVFASSNYVERGFCRDCGTPLTYRNITGPYVSITINSLDDPEQVRPEQVFSPETVVTWCSIVLDLPANQDDHAFPAISSAISDEGPGQLAARISPRPEKCRCSRATASSRIASALQNANRA